MSSDASHRTVLNLQCGQQSDLDVVAKIIAVRQKEDYYAYEREGMWYIGLGSQASLFLDPAGEFATTTAMGTEIKVQPVTSDFASIARSFISRYSTTTRRLYGQVGFNYAAYSREMPFKSGNWPLVSLLIPQIDITLEAGSIRIAGEDEHVIRNLQDLVESDFSLPVTSPVDLDLRRGGERYAQSVQTALSMIETGCFTKVIASRSVGLHGAVDMPATLVHGRRSNTPKRSFSMSHSGFEATGFSPELVMLVNDGKVTTEPLAGTRSNEGNEEECRILREELLNDSKELVEYVISVKEAIDELRHVCSPETIVVDDFMSVRTRGSVQHLGSSVTGHLQPEKDSWDAFNVLFPSITASGIPKKAALAAIYELEEKPRELYSGAVLMIDGQDTFEATLVLRSAFQDKSRQWLQAGAGIIAQSDVQREFDETCEKLRSIAPFIVLRKD